MSVVLPRSKISADSERFFEAELINTIRRGIIAPESLTYLEISNICRVAASVYGEAVDGPDYEDLTPPDILATHLR